MMPLPPNKRVKLPFFYTKREISKLLCKCNKHYSTLAVIWQYFINCISYSFKNTIFCSEPLLLMWACDSL